MIGNQMKSLKWLRGSKVELASVPETETVFITLFVALETLEMSKGSNVTGTGCLMKNFFCACQLAYEGK